MGVWGPREEAVVTGLHESIGERRALQLSAGDAAVAAAVEE